MWRDRLAHYSSRRDYWRGKRVHELGSGTGLVGLVAGYLRVHTVLTDQGTASLLVHYQISG